MVFALIAAWIAYKRAKENGRSGPLWALAGAAVFIGAQLLVTVFVGAGLGIGQAIWGWSDSIYDQLDLPIRVLALGASIGASLLLIRFIERRTQDEVYDQAAPPPPPPTFSDSI